MSTEGLTPFTPLPSDNSEPIIPKKPSYKEKGANMAEMKENAARRAAADVRSLDPQFVKLAEEAVARGESGNSTAGMTSDQLRTRCKNLTHMMLLYLHEIASNKMAMESARISAASIILDRGYGKVGSIVSITADIAQMEDSAAMTFILDEVSAGRITTADAAVLGDLVMKRQQIIDVKAIAARLAELEQREKERASSKVPA